MSDRRVVFVPGSISGVATARKRHRCDGGYLARGRHWIWSGERYVANALPPKHLDIGNARWLRYRFCMDCCPVEYVKGCGSGE